MDRLSSACRITFGAILMIVAVIVVSVAPSRLDSVFCSLEFRSSFARSDVATKDINDDYLLRL